MTLGLASGWTSRWSVALTLALAGPAALQGQDTEWNRYTLEGLTGVYVRAETGEGCTAVGLDPSSVKAEAEATLFESVPILTEQEMLETPGLPELRITIVCSEGENGASGALAFSVEVRVQQSAKMVRDEQVTLAEAVTWWTTSVGATSTQNAPAAVSAAIGERLGAFAEAFALANAEGGQE